jgi:hypothetical protein
MKMEETITKAGREKRYLPKKRLMAEFYAKERYFAGLGEIVTVNNGTISVLYMADKLMTASDVVEVVIVRRSSKGRVPLNKIPCRLISDVELARSLSGTVAGLCSITFEKEMPF